MPRPKKPADELRTERLSGVRLTAGERDYIELQAERAGLSVAEFSRRAVLGLPVHARRSSASDRLLVEVNRIGVNLNQIARAANEGRGIPGDLPEVLAELKTVIKGLADV